MAIRIPMASQKMLLEAGLVPPNCSNVELHIPAAGVMMLRYDVFVTREHLEALSVVFQAMASEVRENQDGPGRAL